MSGKIRIERVVGQGSSGIVLEATDLPLQRRVAVKMLARSSAVAKERFVREARAASRLSSEHVTRLLDVGELEDGTPYLVMEYLVGSTLEQALTRDGLPPIDVALDWILQALDGVAEAHRQGLVHRDLKPENLFLCEQPGRQPVVKVLDFGAVKDLVAKGTKLTREGSTMGSPAYMAPEQVRAEAVDQRADVWAIGVTLYELLSGKLPFGGDSVPETLAAILRDEHAPLRTLRADAPPELDAVLACALSKDPAGRYASATELLGALSAVRARLPRTTPVTKTVYMGPRRSGSDPFADASQIRPRPLIPRVADLPTKTLVDPARPRSKESHVILLAFVAGGIVLVGTIGGLLLTRRAPTRNAASPTVAAPLVSSEPAGSASAPAAQPSAKTAASGRPSLFSWPRKR